MDYLREFEKWLNSDALSKEEKKSLEDMKRKEEKLQLSFGSSMSFGTAGLRSTMDLGPACMNIYTVSQTTQGIAELIKKENGSERGVVISYDSRNNSRLFAECVASVFAANGIKTYIFDDIRPTPELSFALRELSCIAGINITASHNPKEYNGYKAYWEDGAQISPEQAKAVSSAVEKIDVLTGAKKIDFDTAVKSGKIKILTKDFDEKYLSAVEKTAINKDIIKEVSDSLKIVYTPLHGAGRRLVPEILSRMGLKNVYTVDAQMTSDGNFPTVKKPNPEYADVFALGIEIAEREGSDLVIATDPDADRVGVMSRAKNGSFETISGNQMGALMLDYVINAKREKGLLKNGAYAVKSIVSTDMASIIAEKNGIKLYDVLTGFKYIGEVIKNYETENREGEFLLGFEESYGYLFGSYARDKDAVGATMMICEMTAYYKKKNMTLSDALSDLYKRYGLYKEEMLDIYMEGLDGIERRRKTMSDLRENPPKKIGGVKVYSIGDYSAGYVYNLETNTKEPTNLIKSDVLYYTLENGDKIIVRPSGTEPKIKIYFLTHGDDETALKNKIETYKKDAKGFAK
ncbi:MAG: phospho-sugar mutase [Clostridia bacterium]|nr:phospho-sugar mutase [Clostridia bacterium]